jgi:FkbM family methyltransferase
MIQQVKTYLVKLGPESLLVRLALKFHCRRNGFVTQFLDKKITIRRGVREMILADKDFYLVPFTLNCFDQMFEDIESTASEDPSVLDFSNPGSYHYSQYGLTLSFPGMPEDDCIGAYTHWYKPEPGDLVFDIGAHAGLTTCQLARMVGSDGRVVAFEPDPNSLLWLEKNVLDQNISNVTIVPKAIDANTGTAPFNADGTLGAALLNRTVYGHTGGQVEVPTLSLQDACAEFGNPQFMKVDIEGAEVAVVQSAAEFLSSHPINLAFETYHRTRDGRFTWILLEPMLRDIGYDVYSSAEFGQMFTWARPGAGIEK